MMNFDATQVVQAELELGERLLWAGQPIQGITFRGSDIFMIPFSGMSWSGMEQYMGPRFYFLKDAKRIYQQIREAQKNAT